jgi:hypothetical protein
MYNHIHMKLEYYNLRLGILREFLWTYIITNFSDNLPQENWSTELGQFSDGFS